MFKHQKVARNFSEKKNESDSDITNIQPEFSVRIVVCDHYLTKPLPGIDVIYSEFRGSDIKQVPVLRIFGPTPEGRKACLHIHGVFPYFYIPCPTPNPEPQFLYQIAASLDKALNIALKQATSANQHVYKITLVKGLPFYGFHDKEHLFLKIFLYSPSLIRQAVELCSNGAILGQPLQPHESHLNFTLQFFIDFNLFGMSNIDLQSVKFRKNGLSQLSDEPTKSFDEVSFSLKPESSCFYEADCIASHIINRQKVGKGDGIENPGLEEVWNQEMERRKQLNASMSSKSLSQGRLCVEETETHYKFEKIMATKLSDLADKPVDVNNLKELVNYPAETQDGLELLNATDVSNHIQDSTINLSVNETWKKVQEESSYDMDNTIVDEDVALNSSFSLKYSQVFLDSEDLELIDMLQDLDEQPVEDDSAMGTPANADVENDIEFDDAEYSQIFNDETIPLDPYFCNKENSEESPSWNDSFWDGANIPQMDGTFDDDHVKKVRKRKMRPLKVGLSRPKGKKKIDLNELPEELKLNSDQDKGKDSESDEINVSRETIEDISSLHLQRTSKFDSPLKRNCDVRIDSKTLGNEMSNPTKEHSEKVAERTLVQEKPSNLAKRLYDEKNIDINAATLYDKKKEYEPIAGPSNLKNIKNEPLNISFVDNYDSTPEEDLGIESFYDKSKIFDLSVDDKFKTENECLETESQSILENEPNILGVKTQQNYTQDKFHNTHLKIRKCTTKVLTPNIKPPTREDILSTLEKYSIPKIRNPEPYFSCHKDVGNKVEIGQMVLKLNSKLVQDQKPFDKVLDVTSIEEWRQLLFLQTNEMSDVPSKPDALKLLLASNRKVILRPLKRPPTSSEVRKWIENNQNNVKTDELHDDNVEDIHVNIEELESSQAIGLNELNNTISLESTEKQTSDLNNTLQVTMQPDGSFLCFGSSENNKNNNSNSLATPTIETDFLTLMLLEVHTTVRGDLHPDPAFDQIEAVFLTVTNDCPPNHHLQRNVTEIFVVDNSKGTKFLDKCVFNYKINYVDDESVIFEKIIDFVNTHDPDIMCGYEIEMNSWGYLLERAQVLGLEMIKEISRITEKNRQKRYKSDENEFEGRVIGRITFNVWRLFRHELALSSYSFENCMYEVLKERVPTYSYAQLAEWWNDESRILRWIPVEYYMTKLNGTVRMLDKLDIINRTSELARLFGLQWWEVLSRGSQFRVESLMLRAARPLNLVALSPTVKQRAAMRAPECLPLIFEPESRYYADPVIVLDFQSLYPSMMIAYNYCFSTCIGRVQNINGDAPYEFGAWRLRIPQSKLEALTKNGLIHWSPVGVGFVKPSVRRGVLPALLRRILAARQAVKKGMKLQTDDAIKKAMHSRQLGNIPFNIINAKVWMYGCLLTRNGLVHWSPAGVGFVKPSVRRGVLPALLRRILAARQAVKKGMKLQTDDTIRKAMHSRQLGLKLIANVTYGYTAANFSGRMPCVEVGDSVVAKGRETLERAIRLVKNSQWNAKVVYGDTDSLFVRVAGGSRADAFRVGQQIADAVTADNPSPVALKLEKVYQPCILQTKKRYVGYMYESPDQEKPVFEAKGIETVRRDGCPAGVKLLQRCLCALFDTGDMSRVKRLARGALARLADGAAPPHELFFTREYHGAAAYRPGAAAPPNEIAKRVSARDRRRAPRAGERVSWLVCAGAPATPLVRLARAPRELLRDAALRPHVAYYATRVLLPPLHRCLSLLGVDVFKWWLEIGWNREAQIERAGALGGIARYMQRGRCAVCGARGWRSLCAACAARSRPTAALLAARGARAVSHVQACYQICNSCCGHPHYLQCENTECPVLWRRVTAQQKLQQIRDITTNLPPNYIREEFDF